MQNTVRAYEPRDLEAILAAWENASRLAHPFLAEAFLEQERFNIPNLYLPNAETWVVEQAGQVVGFIALIGNEVGAIFVQPANQGTGAGRAMMDHAKDLQGELEVEVFKANSLGRKFYDRYGFVLIEEKNHEPTGNELLRLRFSPRE